MRAYHNDIEVKAEHVARFAAHRAADEVIQGSGFHEGRGCFVGCTLDTYDHAAFPTELGWPEWLARLADGIFEGLPPGGAPQFGTDLLDAVRVGADLDTLRLPFLLLLQRRNLERLQGAPEPYGEACCRALGYVIDALTSTQGEAGELTDEVMLAALVVVRKARALSPSPAALHGLGSAMAATRWSDKWAVASSAADARWAAEAKRLGALPGEGLPPGASIETMRQRDDLLSLVRGA